MEKHVLILGGRGRIGSSVAQDLITHTQAQVTLTGRSPQTHKDINLYDSYGDRSRIKFMILDLADVEQLFQAIAQSDLVIHCAGPFHYRDTRVLEICIEQGVNYLDVSDHRSYSLRALNFHLAAVSAGVTAIINTGIFPGISNSLVRQGVEQFERPEKVHLSYLVSGSGGAGLTVMKTTFLGLQYPFKAWINGKWELVEPFTDRESVDFPPPYRTSDVYWFDMPETYTIPTSFPEIKTVITKFGSLPNFYNYLTWITTHIFPKWLIQRNQTVEFLSYLSYWMTNFTNMFSGIGVAIRCEVTGQKDGRSLTYCVDFIYNQTAIAAGCGTGSIAQLLLEDKLHQPGVLPVEKALPTDLFLQSMSSRGLKINTHWLAT